MDGKINAYRSEEILGKSQLDLTIKVYDGAIAAHRAALEAFQKDDIQTGYDQMERARRFVTHLYTTLDFDKGAEIADRLGKLYAFMLTQIDLAQATKDSEVIDDNITMLDNIRQGWLGLREQNQQVSQVSADSGSMTSNGAFAGTA